MNDKVEYQLLAALHFMITFVLIGFAIISLVNGIKLQFAGETLLAFFFYLAAPLLVFVSYLTYQKAHYKLRVIALARE